MIKIGDKEYRNLEEQVLKNKEDIANHYNMDRVLADFGIRIVGTLPSAEDLPEPYNGNYGDAFAVGDKAPYDFYIWTRADINAGHADDYWFYLGALAIVGPQGERGETGPKGETGERGSIWMSAPRNPDNIIGYLPGDQWLNTVNGYVYTVKEINGNYVWQSQGSIKGPQGIQGPKGDRGETGPQGEKGDKGARGEGAAIVQIVGTITNVDQLPNAEEALNTNAYLQDVNGAWHLWVIVGQPGSYQWVDTGGLTAGTLITKNGDPLSTFDIKNVLQGPFEGTTSSLYNKKIMLQVENTGTTSYEAVAPSQLPSEVRLGSIPCFDAFTNLPAFKDDVSRLLLEEVPEIYLHSASAAPRAYVDAQIEYKTNKRVPYPSSIPNAAMLLGINPDKSVEAIDPATLVGESIGVECWIVQRGESRVLPRDRMYLIRGYGDNSVRLRDRVTGNTIVNACTMAIGMVSSSFWPHNPADNKAWAGFLYQTGSLSLSWNGDVRGEVEVVNINSGTSGTGYTYIYTLGAKSNV